MNRIGLNTVKAKELAFELNGLLANYSVFYQNVRVYIGTLKEIIFLNYISNLRNYTTI